MALTKVLIANRGEIAIRIARTCARLGIKTVGVHSEQDRRSLHLDFCDEVHSLGRGSIAETYLDIPRLIRVLKTSGAKGVHPGYGFLSERAPFAEAVAKAGAEFIGPAPESIRVMGDKLEAKRRMAKMGVPMLPSSGGLLPSDGNALREAKAAAAKIGYPVLLKASAGGGGKGMRVVRKAQELEGALNAASREARAYFGDGTVFLEKYLQNPHHVEVQVIGDGRGGGGHVFDRECSVQRKHQKLVEESPAPLLDRHPRSRRKILALSDRVVEKMKYASAGTLEFLGDDEGNFYFLEMNTRLQVEHPVTEWVTGADLVEWQLRIADGEKLKKGPPVGDRRGHAIEVRIYAETPFEFLPTGGRIGEVHLPSGPFVRVDSAIYPGYEVPLEYDPTLMKLSVWGEDRSQAVQRLRAALDELRIPGVVSNQALFWAITREREFISGDYGTPYLEKRRGALLKLYESELRRLLPCLAVGAVESLRQPTSLAAPPSPVTAWEYVSRRAQLRGEPSA